MARLVAVAVAWLAMIAVDFVVFGGLFAGALEGADDPAVLTPEQLFTRIPAGYASFLLEVLLLWWLLRASPGAGVASGARTGAGAGLLFASAVVLGLWSFSTVPVLALTLWWATLLLQFLAAGAILAAAGTPHWRQVRTWALVGSAALFAAGIVLQNLG
jgi:hypothetical protein